MLSELAFTEREYSLLEKKVVRRVFSHFWSNRFLREGSWQLLILSAHHIKRLLVCSDVKLDYKNLPEEFLVDFFAVADTLCP